MAKLTLSFKGKLLQVIHLKTSEVTIGRDESCDIRIDSLAIAPRQLKIELRAYGWFGEALNHDFPVIVNHHTIKSSRLQHGDMIEMGKHRLMFAEEANNLGPQDQQFQTPPARPMSQKQRPNTGVLQIVSGSSIGHIISLSGAITRLGGSKIGGTIIISRRAEGYFISVLEKSPDVRVDQQPLGNRSVMLTNGMSVQIGNTSLQFFETMAKAS